MLIELVSLLLKNYEASRTNRMSIKFKTLGFSAMRKEVLYLGDLLALQINTTLTETRKEKGGFLDL